MTNSLSKSRTAVTALFALTAVALSSCTTKVEPPPAKVAATTDSARPMMPMAGMPMNGMAMKGPMAPCPLGLTTLALTPAQKATFDSIKTEHKAEMQKQMLAAIARARAVLTDAQRVKFDSASTAHMAMMTTMMNGPGGCMN